MGHISACRSIARAAPSLWGAALSWKRAQKRPKRGRKQQQTPAHNINLSLEPDILIKATIIAQRQPASQ